MTQEEFIKVLDKKRYSYEIEGDKIVVTHKGKLNLDSLTSIPPGVVFENRFEVFLRSLTSIPPGVVFNNKGNKGGFQFDNRAPVYLDSLTSLHPGVEFNNEGHVILNYLTSISPGVEFKNGGGVRLKSLKGDWFYKWESNLKGIESKRLLNVMIKQGVFER